MTDDHIRDQFTRLVNEQAEHDIAEKNGGRREITSVLLILVGAVTVGGSLGAGVYTGDGWWAYAGFWLAIILTATAVAISARPK